MNCLKNFYETCLFDMIASKVFFNNVKCLTSHKGFKFITKNNKKKNFYKIYDEMNIHLDGIVKETLSRTEIKLTEIKTIFIKNHQKCIFFLQKESSCYLNKLKTTT